MTDVMAGASLAHANAILTHANQIAAFVDAVGNGTTTPTTRPDTSKVPELADAASTKAQTGRAVALGQSPGHRP